MRKPKTRTALISLAAAITVSAVATTVLESSAFLTRDDPKVREAYEQGYAWVKTRTEAEPDTTTRLNPTPTPTPPSTPSPSLVIQKDTVRVTDRSVVEFELGEVDDREICDYYASVPEYTSSSVSVKYRGDWVRGCQAAMALRSEKPRGIR